MPAPIIQPVPEHPTPEYWEHRRKLAEEDDRTLAWFGWTVFFLIAACVSFCIALAVRYMFLLSGD